MKGNQHSCIINHASEMSFEALNKTINAGISQQYDVSRLLLAVGISKKCLRLSQKLFFINFDPTFNDQKVSIRKNYVIILCLKLNCASNEIKIILYFFRSIKFSLMKCRFFPVFEIQSSLAVF